MMRIILINATAARSSGALSILKDFMSFVYSQKQLEYKFILLTTTKSIFPSTNTVIVYELMPQTWIDRILWDMNLFQKWCKDNQILPDIILSFQNTCSYLSKKLKNIPFLVYYHQPLPLVKYKWKLFKKKEFKLFLYAHFYSFFVNRWNRNAVYVVQLPYVKELFCKKFSNISSSRVHVVRPNLPCININSIEKQKLCDNKKVFLYPATPLDYKNHKVLLDALELLNKDDKTNAMRISILFTVPLNSSVAAEIKKRKLDSIVTCIGSIPYDKLLSYYKCCDAMLFPSKIETFGLPLIECALFGKPIIASDLPYAREVLEDYHGVEFVNPDIPSEWKEKMLSIINSENYYAPLVQKSGNTWFDFIKIMENTL